VIHYEARQGAFMGGRCEARTERMHSLSLLRLHEYIWPNLVAFDRENNLQTFQV